MKKFIFAFLFLFCGIANSQERLKMAIPSDEEGQVTKLLENLTSSINNEDYKNKSWMDEHKLRYRFSCLLALIFCQDLM